METNISIQERDSFSLLFLKTRICSFVILEVRSFNRNRSGLDNQENREFPVGRSVFFGCESWRCSVMVLLG